jgi:hypothetical protein
MDKLIKQFNLPSYIKGKSFAQASKLIQDKFKDRKDKVSQDTLNALLSRLRDAQESVKPKPSPQEQPQQEQFGFGGQANGEKPGVNAYLGAATSALDFGNQLFGNTNVDVYGNDGAQTTSGVVDAASGALKGAEAGIAFGPLGGVIGGVIGGVSSFIGGERRNKDIHKAQQNKSSREYNISMNNFANGGHINEYSGLTDPPTYIRSRRNNNKVLDYIYADTADKNSTPNLDVGYTAYGANMMKNTDLLNIKNTIKNNDFKKASEEFLGVKSNLNDDAFNFTINGDVSKFTESNPNMKSSADGTYTNNFKFKDSKLGRFLDNNKSALRYAPIAMNAYQLATMKKPEIERLNRLDSRYQQQYVDERRLINSVNEGFGTGQALEGSGGSLGRYSTLSRANQLNKTKAISDAYMKVSDVNRAENSKAQSFNKETDIFNIGQDNRERDINARNRAAYDNNKSKYLSAIGTDLGQIGKEYLYKDQAENIFGYDWKGEYLKKNPNATAAEVIAAEKKALKELKAKNK